MSAEEPSRTATQGNKSTGSRSYWPRRLRVLRGVGRVVLAGLVLGLFAVGVSRVVRMIGLPDVGDPFAGSGRSTPATTAGEDPLEFYRQAFEHLEPLEGVVVPGGPRLQLQQTWPETSAAIRSWAERNHEALRLFRRGAECRLAVREPSAETRGHGKELLNKEFQTYQELVHLALLEASRLADQGDMEAAWGWYRAALRSTYHCADDGDVRGASLVRGRLIAQHGRGIVAGQIHAWALDERTGAGVLRTAISDVIACETLVRPDLVTLESGYRSLMHDLEAGQWSHPRDPSDFRVGRTGWQLPQPLGELWWQGRRFLDSEPQRSKRVMRLAFANWRAWLAQPQGRRPGPAIRSVVRFPRYSPGQVEFFAFGPEALPAARRMSPQRLAEWFETTDDARVPLSDFWSMFQLVRRQERSGHAALVLHLAEQLWIHERGEPPPRLEALVGPYLKSLPDDGSSELDDGVTPTTESR